MKLANAGKTISVIGLGYIGLPTPAVFASRGLQVVGIDVNRHAVDTINRGEIHIVEPELDMLVRAAVAAGKLRATTIPEPADACMVAVPTPFKGDHQPDLSYIEAAARSIAPVLKRGDLVVLESPSPVGATEQLAGWLAAARPDLSFPQQSGDVSDIRVAYCPERVLPGRVLHELVDNDRVIGGMTSRCSEAAAALYKIFVAGECVITNARTAEMCKLTENSYRDVNILQPGCGVGGHCIAVDPWFIVDSNPGEARLIRTAREVNDDKPQWVVAKMWKKPWPPHWHRGRPKPNCASPASASPSSPTSTTSAKAPRYRWPLNSPAVTPAASAWSNPTSRRCQKACAGRGSRTSTLRRRVQRPASSSFSSIIRNSSAATSSPVTGKRLSIPVEFGKA